MCRKRDTRRYLERERSKNDDSFKAHKVNDKNTHVCHSKKKRALFLFRIWVKFRVEPRKYYFFVHAFVATRSVCVALNVYENSLRPGRTNVRPAPEKTP